VESVLARVPRAAAATLADTLALDAAARSEAEVVIAALARATRAG
jgi:hypothetical protein